MKLMTTYPCCSGKARFEATDGVPSEKYDRTCSHCSKTWTITRKLLGDRNGVRTDRFDWESITEAD